MIVCGLAALGYVGYTLFGGPVGDAKINNSQFYLEQASDINPPEADRHVVVVYGTLTPPNDRPSSWACTKRVWDWGDGQLTRQDDCTAWSTDVDVVFTADHVYAEAGQYLITLYVQNDRGQTYQSDELKVQAP